MKLYEALQQMAKGKKIKVVDLSDKPDVLVETTITVKPGKIVNIRNDYRGTHHLKDMK